ncbi:GntR family transcriptional regulator [Vibrio mediterranei]|uniref:GntR family transcriptional regulator n=1 Tax=Vibrio TaxID=662 RepID=UPI001F484CA9|nr:MULTISPECIES: GntR family transcriptional regulator [Vibrio]MCF4174219.1 GntR family transcriptional regulator [Vibrio sp. McD22-P3]MCY9854458.1 GntR family transcriptional regulator [Vibrio mediterranei]
MSNIKVKAQQYLEKDIIEQLLRPSERLVIKDLARRYSLGLSPLREAVQALSHTGFIHYRPNHGACVAPLSMDELNSIVDFLCHQLLPKKGVAPEKENDGVVQEYQLLYHFRKFGESTKLNDPDLPSFYHIDEHLVGMFELLIPTNKAVVVQRAIHQSLQNLRRYLRLYTIHHCQQWRRLYAPSELDMVVHKAIYSARSDYRELLTTYLINIHSVLGESMVLGSNPLFTYESVAVSLKR